MLPFFFIIIFFFFIIIIFFFFDIIILACASIGLLVPTCWPVCEEAAVAALTENAPIAAMREVASTIVFK